MRPAAIVTWCIALLLAIAIAVVSIHARSHRIATCTRVGGVHSTFPAEPKDACAQARVQEDRTLVAAAISAIVVVMGTAVALGLQRRGGPD